MIDGKIAIDQAGQYLKNLFPKSDKIKLEEIELTDDQKFWNITLSYIDQDDGSLFVNQARQYKLFKVNADDGKVLSMKIRQI